MTGKIARPIALLAVAAAFGFHLPAAAFADSCETDSKAGKVSGIVRGPDGNGAEGVHVAVKPGRHATTTVYGGFFTVLGVEPGVYCVTVSLDGRTLQSIKGVTVTGGRTTHLDFGLPARSLLREHRRLIILVASSVLCIILSVGIKQAINRRNEARAETVTEPAAD